MSSLHKATSPPSPAAAPAAAAPSKKPSSYRLPKLVMEWARPFRRRFAAVGILVFASSIAGAAVPYTFGVIVDGVQKGWSVQKILVFGVVASCLVLLLRSLLECWNAVIRIRYLETAMLWHFRKLAAEAVCGFSVGQVQNESSGFRQSVLSRGISAAEQLVFLILHDLWPLVGQVLVVSVALFATTTWWLAAATFAIGAAQVAYRVWINSTYLPTLTKLSRDETRLEKRMSEYLRHMNIALLNSQAERLLESQDVSRWEFMRREIAFWVGHVWRMYVTDVLAILGRCTLFGLAAWLAATHRMSAGTFLVYVTWSGQLLAALDRFGQIFRQFARNVPHVRRLEAMLDIPPAVRLPAEPYRPDGDLRGEIEFRDVRFSYPVRTSLEEIEKVEGDEAAEPPSPKEALSGVSFRVMPGERVALVGKSGAGKSTIGQLLGRAYDPDGGVILVDGVDVRSFDLAWFRSRLGYVEQDVTLFEGTVAENIALAVGGDIAKVQNLELLLRQSRVSDFLPRLGPAGLDAEIGERGVKLSGGQRQRLGIARALAKRPRIVVLDEATASLDAENERGVYEAVFGEGLSGITAIIIAHNLRTIRRADRIVFFEGGQVLATGTHDDLMVSCAPYRELVEMQAYE